MEKIPVLFTQKGSNYLADDRFDCWDVKRNALNYSGKAPVIAHPPCRLFGRLKGLTTAPQWEKQLGYYAIGTVRKNGGIVENPAHSDLFKITGCNLDGGCDEFGGFLIDVQLNWFGFPVRKRTWLYVCGCSRSDVPGHPLNFDMITHTVGRNSKSKTNLMKKQLEKNYRAKTPIKMIDWFAEIMVVIQEQKRVSNGY